MSAIFIYFPLITLEARIITSIKTRKVNRLEVSGGKLMKILNNKLVHGFISFHLEEKKSTREAQYNRAKQSACFLSLDGNTKASSIVLDRQKQKQNSEIQIAIMSIELQTKPKPL